MLNCNSLYKLLFPHFCFGVALIGVLIELLTKRRTLTCLFSVENFRHDFFYEILILSKSKSINFFCFPIITNQTNHDYFKGKNLGTIPYVFFVRFLTKFLVIISNP